MNFKTAAYGATAFLTLLFANFSLFLHSKANLEESLLEEKFGEAYREYRRHTGKFVPRYKK